MTLWDTVAMADLPSDAQIEFAERLGRLAGARGLSRELNPWPKAEKGEARVLHFRWRMAYAAAQAAGHVARPSDA